MTFKDRTVSLSGRERACNRWSVERSWEERGKKMCVEGGGEKREESRRMGMMKGSGMALSHFAIVPTPTTFNS